MWKRSDKEAPPDIFGADDGSEGGYEQQENWVIHKTLRGHLQVETTVLKLSWSKLK